VGEGQGEELRDTFLSKYSDLTIARQVLSDHQRYFGWEVEYWTRIGFVRAWRLRGVAASIRYWRCIIWVTTGLGTCSHGRRFPRKDDWSEFLEKVKEKTETLISNPNPTTLVVERRVPGKADKSDLLGYLLLDSLESRRIVLRIEGVGLRRP
jgi:hypothetical protein